jgi:hypothetical protein
MKAWAGVFFCAGLILLGSTALAEGIYQYRNKSTGRDVFVNRLDQVPLKYRSSAKLVVEDAPPESGESSGEPSPAETRPSTVSAAAKQVVEMGTELRKVSPAGWRNPSAIAGHMVDRKLLAAGTRPLGDSERWQLKRLLMTILGFALAASLFSFVVWIVLLVVAFRDGNPWWALFIFLFYPLAYLYLFLVVEKGRRWFKTVCAAGLVAPLLVGLVSAWRFSAWLHTIIVARGGGP